MAKKIRNTEGTETVELEDTDFDTEGLVMVTKNGDVLHVHPTTLKAHEEAGWKLA